MRLGRAFCLFGSMMGVWFFCPRWVFWAQCVSVLVLLVLDFMNYYHARRFYESTLAEAMEEEARRERCRALNPHRWGQE